MVRNSSTGICRLGASGKGSNSPADAPTRKTTMRTWSRRTGRMCASCWADRYDSLAAVEALNDLYRHELRLWLNLFLPSVKLVKKVRVGSKLRRVYDTPQTPLQRVATSPQAHAARVAESQSLRESLNPFALAKAIDRKLEHIYELADRWLNPKVLQGLPATERTESSRPNGGGKTSIIPARRAHVPALDFHRLKAEQARILQTED